MLTGLVVRNIHHICLRHAGDTGSIWVSRFTRAPRRRHYHSPSPFRVFQIPSQLIYRSRALGSSENVGLAKPFLGSAQMVEKRPQDTVRPPPRYHLTDMEQLVLEAFRLLRANSWARAVGDSLLSLTCANPVSIADLFGKPIHRIDSIS